LKFVPILDKEFILSDIPIRDYVEMSKGKSALYNIKREGIVIRSVDDPKKVSFKIINPKFLLEYDE